MHALWNSVCIVCYSIVLSVMRRSCSSDVSACAEREVFWTTVMLSLMIANSALSLVLWRVCQSWFSNVVGILSISVSCVTLCWSLFGIHVLFSEANRTSCSPHVRKWAIGIWAWEFAIGTCPKLLLMLLFIVASVMLMVAERNGTNPWLPENALSHHRPPTPAPELLRQRLKVLPYIDLQNASTVNVSAANSEPNRRCLFSSQTEEQEIAAPPVRSSNSQPTAAALGEALVGPISSLHAILSTQDSVDGQHRRVHTNDCPSCPICFAAFEQSDLVVQMPCDERHIFHRTCLFTWFDTSGTCPVCRSDLVDLFKEKDKQDDTETNQEKRSWWERWSHRSTNNSNHRATEEMV